MSTPEPEDREDADAIERISDPDDYNLRRRLRQLHDAKDRVRELRDTTLRREQFDRSFTKAQRDLFVAEAVTDYIDELEPLLDKIERADEFLEQEVATINDETITLRDIQASRGTITIEDKTHRIPYQASMDAWRECNRYFEQVAGVVFDEEMPVASIDS